MAIRFTRTRNIRAGKGSEAIALGVRIRDYFVEKHGIEANFGVQVGGEMGTVHFFLDADDWNHFNEIGTAIWTDERYVALEAEADDLFLQGGNDTIINLQ
jgi:hypothetical protein